jgi:hypothetical protein
MDVAAQARHEGGGPGRDEDLRNEGTWESPTEDEIRQRAYELYRERERESGGPVDDWLQAEAELFLERCRRHP